MDVVRAEAISSEAEGQIENAYQVIIHFLPAGGKFKAEDLWMLGALSYSWRCTTIPYDG